MRHLKPPSPRQPIQRAVALWPWLLLATSLWVGSRPAYADGMLFAGHDWSSMRSLAQREQRAAIVHRNGIEKMIVAINFEPEDQDNALWIFPVPGRPSETKVDVLDSFPRFYGRDPRSDAASAIYGSFLLLRTTQLYPLLEFAMVNLAIPSIGHRDVISHAEVEKWGIRAEVITTKSLDGLDAYLQEKKVKIPRESLATFEPYLSDRYVLVVSWIASREQLLKEFPEYRERRMPRYGRWPCLYVEFPTERAFYPLRPTRAYEAAPAVVRLFVLGFVQPETDSSPTYPMRVSYYQQSGFAEGTPKQFSEGHPAGEDASYTRVSIDTQAGNLRDDLWFSPANKPLGWRYIKKVLPVVIWLLPVLLAALSYVAAGLSGLILLGQWKGYARLGLWNLLTLIGLVFAVRRLGGERGSNLRKARTLRGKLGFVRLFTGLFTALVLALQMILAIPLGEDGIGLIFGSFVMLVLYGLVPFLKDASGLDPPETAPGKAA